MSRCGCAAAAARRGSANAAASRFTPDATSPVQHSTPHVPASCTSQTVIWHLPVPPPKAAPAPLLLWPLLPVLTPTNALAASTPEHQNFLHVPA